MTFKDALKFWLAQAAIGVGAVVVIMLVIALGFLVVGLWDHWLGNRRK